MATVNIILTSSYLPQCFQ